MFTGIIEEIGHVNNVKKGTASAILTIQAEKVLEGTHIGRQHCCQWCVPYSDRGYMIIHLLRM